MIYPIVAYGDPVLRKKCREITISEKETIDTLINDMFETMYNAQGVGLAAPQIGKDIRLFIVDAEPMDEEECAGFKKVFINPQIIEETGTEWPYEEGCLSIPGIQENVNRKNVIKMSYLDENWVEHTEEFDGMKARVIQHEYDHIEGILFTDYLSPFKKRMLKNKLQNITRGNIPLKYRMKFVTK